MSDTTDFKCPHGFPRSMHCPACSTALQFPTYPGIPVEVPTKEERQAERRAAWIRDNVAVMFGAIRGVTAAERLNVVERMADELVKRGYL